MNLYFDTSALVKLVVDEPGTEWTVGLWHDFPKKVAGRLAYVETHAALAAAERGGRVSPEQAARARSEFESAWKELTIIDAGDDVVRSAAALARRKSLRGYDAVHLASALATSRQRGDTLMITWDAKLAEASVAEGISVVRTTRLVGLLQTYSRHAA